MNRQEIMKQVSQASVKVSAYDTAVVGLTQSYQSAALLGDNKRMNELRSQIHDNMDLSLDARGHIAYLTQELSKLNDY